MTDDTRCPNTDLHGQQCWLPSGHVGRHSRARPWQALAETTVVATDGDYRILRSPDGWFEAQQRFKPGMTDGYARVSLNSDGYWVDPESFTDGVRMRRMQYKSREQAEAVIARAKSIEGKP